MQTSPNTFKLALDENQLNTFDQTVQDNFGQTLQDLANDDPFAAYALIVDRALSMHDVNGVFFSHRHLLDDGVITEETVIGRLLKRRIPDPAEQRIEVEVHSWSTANRRLLIRRQAAPYRAFSFYVGPLELSK